MQSDKTRFIVVTSIFDPTPAVRRLGTQAPGRVVVAGDRKTPADWRCDGVTYLGPDDQVARGWRVAEVLPWNHYARKMLGYLEAISTGAGELVDLDDDNIPKPDWDFPAFNGRFPQVRSGRYYNVYERFADVPIWPRGFPLRYVTGVADVEEIEAECQVGVWQALADGDPDVDAIYRLTVGTDPVQFRPGAPLVLAPGTVCPFNSQNTLFRREVFPLLFLPATVTFRATDIIRSLIAQPILWAADLRVGFVGPTVRQERNQHDYLADFASEIPLYLHAEEISDAVGEAVKGSSSIEENLRAAYAALAERGLVQPGELELLDAWLDDLKSVSGRGA